MHVCMQEYKKEEMPEKAVRTFKDVRGCDEAKEELKEVVEFLKNPGGCACALLPAAGDQQWW